MTAATADCQEQISAATATVEKRMSEVLVEASCSPARGICEEGTHCPPSPVINIKCATLAYHSVVATPPTLAQQGRIEHSLEQHGANKLCPVVLVAAQQSTQHGCWKKVSLMEPMRRLSTLLESSKRHVTQHVRAYLGSFRHVLGPRAVRA
jgi:hypothetical protein